MDRRDFLRSLVGGVAATAAVRTFPFRVFSFPSEPVILAPMFDQLCATTLADLRKELLYDNFFFVDTPFLKYLRAPDETQFLC